MIFFDISVNQSCFFNNYFYFCYLCTIKYPFNFNIKIKIYRLSSNSMIYYFIETGKCERIISHLAIYSFLYKFGNKVKRIKLLPLEKYIFPKLIPFDNLMWKRIKCFVSIIRQTNISKQAMAWRKERVIWIHYIYFENTII